MAEVTYTIGGAAGRGIESTGMAFARIHARAGYQVYTWQEYESRIRGGHNHYQVRVSDKPLTSHSQTHSIVVALDAQSIAELLPDVASGGAVIYESTRDDIAPALIAAHGARPLPAPLLEIATTLGGDEIMANTVATSLAAALTGLDFPEIEAVIRENFGRRGAQATEANLAVARAGYDWGRKSLPDFAHRLPPAPVLPEPQMLLHANHAVALGAIAAGCKVVAGYPMTPWSSILDFLIQQRDAGIVALQMEDEIAAISFALGASFAGTRAMTGSSGGGFALMVEHLSLAGMAEIPIVVIEVQRGGPATGMPTRTEQADLLFVLNPAHGEFPLIVTAIKDPLDAFYRTAKAFNLADQCQCPVIVLSDAHLANSLRTVPLSALDSERVTREIDRGEILTHRDLDARAAPYRRYLLTESGVSPRAVPGHPQAVVHSMSDEHTETGAVTENAELRRQMMAKRMRKLAVARARMEPPDLYGPIDAPLTLVGWGGTYGVLCEAVDRAHDRLNLVHYTDLFPFPLAGDAPLRRARRLVAVEQNYTAQLARYLRGETGIEIADHICKYDGRPMSADWILGRLEELSP